MCRLPSQGLPAARSQPEAGRGPPLTALPLGTQVRPWPAPSPDVPCVALPSPPEASPVPPSWTRSPEAPGAQQGAAGSSPAPGQQGASTPCDPGLGRGQGATPIGFVRSLLILKAHFCNKQSLLAEVTGLSALSDQLQESKTRLCLAWRSSQSSWGLFPRAGAEPPLDSTRLCRSAKPL